MGNLVLLSDVVTLKETTEQIKNDFLISLEEAADLILIGLRKHKLSMQFWKIPSKGLLYKDDEFGQLDVIDAWHDSRWWDESHQQRQDELRGLAGVGNSHESRVEDMALLRRDAYRLLLSDLHDESSDRMHAPLTLPLDCASHNRTHELARLASHSLSNCIGLT